MFLVPKNGLSCQAGRMARPRKHPHEARTERCAHIRLTMAERHDMESKAAALGVSVANYARSRLCGYRLPTRRDVELGSVAVSLNRIGVNLNQIARAANSGQGLPGDFAAVMAELREVMANIFLALK